MMAVFSDGLNNSHKYGALLANSGYAVVKNSYFGDRYARIKTLCLHQQSYLIFN